MQSPRSPLPHTVNLSTLPASSHAMPAVPVTAYPLPYDPETDYHAYQSEANIYLLINTWTCPSPRPFQSLVLLVESPLQDCTITVSLLPCMPAHASDSD